MLTPLLKPNTQLDPNAGFTLAESIVTVLLVGVLTMIAAPQFSRGDRALRDTTNRISSVFKLARSKAITRSNAYRLTPAVGSNNEIVVEYAAQCEATMWQIDQAFDEESRFDKDVKFDTNTPATVNGTGTSNWSLCYDNRGQADVNLVLNLVQDEEVLISEIEIFRGGTVESRLTLSNSTP